MRKFVSEKKANKINNIRKDIYKILHKTKKMVIIKFQKMIPKNDYKCFADVNTSI